VEVGALEVRHGLKALLPYGVLLIMNQEEHDRHLCGSDEAALTLGSEGNECRLLDGVVELAVDDSPHPWLHRVEGYCQDDLTHIQAMGLRPAALVDRNVSVVAELKECVI
jgi:hypothetical protein